MIVVVGTIVGGKDDGKTLGFWDVFDTLHFPLLDLLDRVKHNYMTHASRPDFAAEVICIGRGNDGLPQAFQIPQEWKDAAAKARQAAKEAETLATEKDGRPANNASLRSPPTGE